MLERLQLKSEFVDGLRFTDAATVEVVEMVLSGTINKSIVSAINAAGGRAVGLSGKDGNLIQAQRSEEHTSELQSLMRILYAVFCLKKKKKKKKKTTKKTIKIKRDNKEWKT